VCVCDGFSALCHIRQQPGKILGGHAGFPS
jgi:hypothetical protein